MLPENDWLAFSFFSPQQEWPRFLDVLDGFLNSGAIKPLMAMRIIKFSQLYGSNIRLFVQATAGQSPLLLAELQAFFANNFPLQIIPGRHGQTPAGNREMLMIRVLLSDLMIKAFCTEPVNDETLLTVALYLQFALLKDKKAAKTILSSFAGTAIFIDDRFLCASQLEEEYIANCEFLHEIKSHLEGNQFAVLPSWLPPWLAGYEMILRSIPEHRLPAFCRSTLYSVIKQLGLSVSLVTRLEYYIKKSAQAETVKN
ncbi:hypothetical protein [Longitalea arenae]|uniref:hypothetical protein n=1 Tax=Longitalea arenae TaxID=2812558 RepID=UPI0019671404|nr:hypothetical protein [Longitalea arenae]